MNKILVFLTILALPLIAIAQPGRDSSKPGPEIAAPGVDKEKPGKPDPKSAAGSNAAKKAAGAAAAGVAVKKATSTVDKKTKDIKPGRGNPVEEK